jgi:hypothetical protein
MTKATVTKIFLAGVLAAIAGGIVVLVTAGIAYTNGVFVMDGQDVVGLRSGPFTWTLLGVGLVGALAMAAGAVAGLIAWIGALLNVSQLDSKVWFVVLLLLGLTNFGILGMIAYIIAGPDGTTRTATRQVPAPVGA